MTFLNNKFSSQKIYPKFLPSTLTFLYLAFALYASYVMSLLSSPVKPIGFFWGVTTLVMPAIELFLVSTICVVFWKVLKSTSLIVRVILALTPLCLIGVVYVVQMFSVHVSGDYISVLAIQNRAEMQYLPLHKLALPGAAILVLFVVASWMLLKESQIQKEINIGLNRKNIIALACALIMFGGIIDSSSSQGDPVYLNPALSPATSLVNNYRSIHASGAAAEDITKAIQSYRDQPEKALFELNQNPESRFTFLKETLEHGELPFNRRVNRAKATNLIVVFMEGVPARALSSYGSKFGDLMPNLEGHAENFMRVDNYYSHTAATFRGLLGQLSSSYPRAGGSGEGGWVSINDETLASTTYQTVPHILTKIGYETTFLSPHHNSNVLNLMLKSIGFSSVLTSEELPAVANFSYPKFDSKRSAEDRFLFASLIADLKEKEEKEGNKKFFLATYNKGSHAFYDVLAWGEHYGDGKNSALNRFHELDRSLADFLDYFFKSVHAQNTTLILTSDHAAFPEPDVIEAFEGSDYQSIFIDRIPLLIYSPTYELPLRFDADSRTSLSLAPTLLHLLGVEGTPHAFLTHSLFGPKPRGDFSIAAIPPQYYEIKRQSGVEVIEKRSENPAVNEAISIIQHYHKLEEQNLVFPGD